MLTIREPAAGDEAAYLLLMRQVHELHAGNRPDVYRPFQEEALREGFGRLPSGESGFALLAELDGEPAGLCVALYKAPPDNPLVRPRRVAFLDDLCVAEAHRGRGIGTRLFQAARQRAEADGMESLELMVWGFNEQARRFYERLGMTEKSRILELGLRGRQNPRNTGRNTLMEQLQVKRLTATALLPRRATAGSAGYDLCADEAVTIRPHEIVRVHTGLSIGIGDSRVVGLIYARSGLASKHGIAPINCVGVIDSDYRGELQVPLTNHSETPFEIRPGDRIAQLVLAPVYTPELIEVKELSETQRGEGGFGSTGSGA